MDDREPERFVSGVTLVNVSGEQSVILKIEGGALSFADRSLWEELNLSVLAGEFLAVLGANGSGKTSLLKAILGQQRLDSGSITLSGKKVTRGDRRIGYIPQQKLATAGVPLLGRDLVGFGVDGHRFGLPFPSRAHRQKVEAAIHAVGAAEFAQFSIGSLSGGEQQRLRVAQALVGEPALLLCDEPLISLDLNNQREVAELIDVERRRNGTAGALLYLTSHLAPWLLCLGSSPPPPLPRAPPTKNCHPHRQPPRSRSRRGPSTPLIASPDRGCQWKNVRRLSTGFGQPSQGSD